MEGYLKSPSAFRPVNLLYFIVICLMVANLLLAWMPQYVRLTVSELLFVFLPGLLYLRLSRQPVSVRVRWRWPGWQVAVLAIAIGAGLYPLSAVSAGVLVGVLGYTSFAVPPDAIPTTIVMGLFAILSYAILAPLCEEFLFRGILQPVYETRGWKWGILFVSFLFVAFHLSLLQGLSIILLALALGFVNYRTQSLPASILTHFGANGLAALMVTQQVFPTGIQNWITTMPALIGGLMLAGLALFGLIRFTAARPAVEPGFEGAPLPRISRPGISTTWPLLAALAIFLAMIGTEWVYSRSPQAVDILRAPGPALQVSASPWSASQTWRYEIRNIVEDVVGEGECNLTADGNEMELTCASTVRAYEVNTGQGTYASSGGRRVDEARWQAANGKFISGLTTLDLQGGFQSQVDFRYCVDRIEIRYQEDGQGEKRLDLPFRQTALSTDPTLLLAPDNTWPWQLAGITDAELSFETEPSRAVLRFNPFTWNNTIGASSPLAEPRLVTAGALEELQTPAGQYLARPVKSGDRDIAWYATRNGALTVIQYFNGIETWILRE